MKYLKTVPIAILLAAWMAQCPTTIRAQEQQQNDSAPKSAGKAIPPVGGDQGDQDQDQAIPAIQPDDNPVTGFQDLTSGTPSEKRSYWIPGISYNNFIQSNAPTAGGEGQWNSTSYLVGTFSLLQDWGTSQLAVNYSGGESFSSNATMGNSQFQQLGAFQTFNWRRVRLTLLDQFAYLPEAQFGFGAGSDLAIPGVGGALAPPLPGLQSGLTPNQSIFNTMGPRYSNASGMQFNFALSRRSSFTVGGVFSFLRFTEAGNIDSNDVILNAGYNYQLNRTDALGVSYRFSSYQFPGQPQAIGDHTVQLTYGKRLTGRMALRLSIGPEVTVFRLAPAVNTGTERNAVAGSANLAYALRVWNVGLDYNHSVTNGSGVLLGATTDQVTVSANRRLSRVWSGNLNFGYARNTNVASTGANPGIAYDALYVGAGLQRPFSRTTNFTVNYNADIQVSNTGTCTGTTCGNFTTHEIIVGFNWRARPFVLH
jgi:hypothetical protein